ncbi:ATP-dependent helicase, partial [Camelimonas fluminis]
QKSATKGIRCDSWRSKSALDAERNSDGAVAAWDVLQKNRKAEETVGLLGTRDALENIAMLYDGEKADAQVLDYNDIIIKTVELLETNTGVRRYYQTMFRMVLIDEYQDTNATQEHLIRLMLNPQVNITCVGDEDQSVYGWRGAEIKNILTFQGRYNGANVIKLEQNFRSTSSILDAANKLIARNEDRLGKKLYTMAAARAPITHYRFSDPRQEAASIVNAIADLHEQGVPYNSIAILGRYATMFATIQLPLAQARIPFTITAGKKAQETQDIQNIIAYFRFAKNRRDDYALQRILTAKPRGLGPTKMKKVSEEARTRHIPMIDAIASLLASSELKGKLGEGLTNLLNFLNELADDYQLEVPPAEIYEKVVVELELDKDLAKATEKAGNVVEKIARNKAHAGVQRRADRIAELQAAITSAPNLDEMVDSLALDPVDNNEITDGVWIGTIHAAKGLEFDHVILPAWSEGIFPSSRIVRQLASRDLPADEESRLRRDLEEERRLAYVGLTRAKKTATITSVESFHGEYDLPPSRFLGDISPALTKTATYR